MPISPEKPPAAPASEGAPRRGKKRWRDELVLLLIVLLIAVDAVQPPRRQVLVHASVALINVYQSLGRPISRRVVVCRFEPSCSEYSEQAFGKYGFWQGLWMTASRLSRCRGTTPAGTIDNP